VHAITHLLIHYRYIGVFFMFTTEMIGAPFPAETTLTACGVLWARGMFSFWPLWAAAVAGNMVGSTLSYALGRYLGMPLLTRYGRFIFITPVRLTRAQAFFEGHRRTVLIVGKFISGVRLLAPFFAGINRMPLWSFTVVNGLTAFVWATVYLVEGRFFNALWVRFHAWLGVGGPILLLLLIMGSILIRRRMRRRHAVR
jgi:membrane protein DedA with SNARE-associated domain